MAVQDTLLVLPAELLLQISSYLTTTDLCSLRRSCRDVEGTLRHSFTREFFTKRQFMLEEVSLQALVDISRHPVYSQSIQDVIISLHSVQGSIAPSIYDNLLHQHGHLAQDILLGTGQARDMLVTALSRLPNLRSFNLRDYNARGRLRDGDRTSWKSYGWSYHDALQGANQQHNLEHGDRAEILYSAGFGLVLHALGLANSSPERFEVFFRHRCDYGVGLPLHGLRILDGPLAGSVKRVLHGLKVLMLTLAGPDSSMKELLDPRPSEFERVAHPLKRLLEHAPNLERLRLNFSPDQVYVQGYLEWLAMPTAVAWSNLTCLDIGMVCLKDSVLTSVIGKFNLTELNLWKITLISSDEDEDESPWIDFLRSLTALSKANTRTMRKMTIGYSTTETPGRESTPVPVFFYQDDGESYPTRLAAYNASTDGADFSQWVETLAKKVKENLTARQIHPTAIFTSDEDEEDSEDESDDEDEELDSDIEDESDVSDDGDY